MKLEIEPGTLSILKDPFKKDSLEEIHFHVTKHLFTKQWIFSASVGFKNGETNGGQMITASTFPELCKKVDEFLESI